MSVNYKVSLVFKRVLGYFDQFKGPDPSCKCRITLLTWAAEQLLDYGATNMRRSHKWNCRGRESGESALFEIRKICNTGDFFVTTSTRGPTMVVLEEKSFDLGGF